jgi:hypothetical protein
MNRLELQVFQIKFRFYVHTYTNHDSYLHHVLDLELRVIKSTVLISKS